MNLAELFRHENNLQVLPAGLDLFKVGDHGDLMYILMSGSAEIRVHNKVVETAQVGAIFGEMAMIDESVRSATVTAVSECKLLPITRDRFTFLIQQTPNFALYMMKVIAERLRKTDGYL